MKKLLALFVVVLGFSAASFAQVTATATASAAIVSPIAITKTIDMNFGNVAVNNLPGTVVLPTSGARTRTGGVTLPAVPGTVATAEFTVTGTPGYAYTFTLPAGATTVTNGTGGSMTVDTWTSDAGASLVGGTQTVKVGATLNVAGSQAPGIYTSATAFSVTVNYN